VIDANMARLANKIASFREDQEIEQAVGKPQVRPAQGGVLSLQLNIVSSLYNKTYNVGRTIHGLRLMRQGTPKGLVLRLITPERIERIYPGVTVRVYSENAQLEMVTDESMGVFTPTSTSVANLVLFTQPGVDFEEPEQTLAWNYTAQSVISAVNQSPVGEVGVAMGDVHGFRLRIQTDAALTGAEQFQLWHSPDNGTTWIPTAAVYAVNNPVAGTQLYSWLDEAVSVVNPQARLFVVALNMGGSSFIWPTIEVYKK
jgi:hypothetical protein